MDYGKTKIGFFEEHVVFPPRASVELLDRLRASAARTEKGVWQ